MTQLCIILLCSGLVAEATSVPQPPAPPVIELLETDARNVAYIEHTGAYWSLGSVIDAVARDAQAVGVRDKLLIRYIAGPASSPGEVHAQVGYELSGMDPPKSPYQLAHWPRALVVTRTIPGADGLSPRHQAALKSWVSAEGLVPSGDLIAMVELAEKGGGTTIERIRIQMPVCTPDPPVSELMVESVPALPTLIAADIEPEDPVVTKVITLPSRNPKEEAEPLQPETVTMQPPSAAGPTHAYGPQVKTRAEIQLPAQRPAIGVRNLIDSESFSELAEAMMPADANAASRQWTDELVGRIIALANGVQKLAPGDEGWLLPLAAELGIRRDQQRADEQKSPRRVIGPALATTNHSAERKFVILEVDRLMAGLAYGSYTPDQVREKLTEILEVVPTLVTFQ